MHVLLTHQELVVRRAPFLASAVAGSVTWIAAVLLGQPALTVVWLWMAPLVIVPMGLALLSTPFDSSRFEPWQFFAAAMVPLAWTFEQGPLAAACCLPWLAVCLSIAFGGVKTFANSKVDERSLARLAARSLIVVGAVFLVASRFGFRPFDFSDEIIQLTAVHFHYAGFALPIIAAGVVAERRHVIVRGAVWALLFGIPLVAVGMTWFRPLELAGVFLLVAGTMVLAAAQLHVAYTSRSGLARFLLAVSSVSLLGAMPLAAAYAMQSNDPQPWLDIPTMAAVHGTANAIGFSLAGLGGWVLRTNRH